MDEEKFVDIFPLPFSISFSFVAHSVFVSVGHVYCLEMKLEKCEEEKTMNEAFRSCR